MGIRLKYIAILSVLATGASGRVEAHVDYVTEGDDSIAPLPFLLDTLTDPVNAGLLLGGGLVVSVTALGYLKILPVSRDIMVFREAMGDYNDLIPWLLRLSFGIPLIGAGFVVYLFSPAVQPQLPLVSSPSRLILIGIGFLLLFGLATRVAAAIGVGLYLLSLAFSPALLLASEFIPGLLAIVLVGSGRPSADHVLDTMASAEGTLYSEIDPIHRLSARFDTIVTPFEPFVATIVRVGLGLNFIFLGVSQKLLEPGPALSVVEKYDLSGVIAVDPGLWVVGAGLAEVALGTALVIGLFTRASSMIALFLFTLTLFALPDDPVLAHLTFFGLASLLLITGSGPLAVDLTLGKTIPTLENEQVSSAAYNT